MIRRHGEPPRTGIRYPQRTGVYAILPKDGQLLLTFQGDPHDEVQLPGGGVDAGEQPLTALHREVFEETGWHIAAPRRVGAFRRFTYMPDYKRHAAKLCHVYIARPTLRIGPPIEPNHTAVWMRPELALRLLANDGDADLLARVMGAL